MSVDSAGGENAGFAFDPAISGDGRYVVFVSTSSTLVAGDTNGVSDVFVRDTVLEITTRVNVDLTGGEANASGIRTAISADGRYIAFDSDATNLVTDDTNGFDDVFVKANPQPTITAVAPVTVPRGTTTSITVTGTSFLPVAIFLLTGDGITLTNVTVVSETEITADVTVAAGATTGARLMLYELAGTGAGPFAGAIGLGFITVT